MDLTRRWRNIAANYAWSRAGAGVANINVPGIRRVSLKDFDQSDDHQQQRPSAAKGQDILLLQQEQDSQSNQHSGPHKTVGTATVALARQILRSDKTGSTRKQPGAYADQDKGHNRPNPRNQKPRLCSIKITPRTMRTMAPVGIREVSTLSPVLKVQ